MTKGDRIKKAREHLGITQTELALAIQTTKQNIYKYENNIISNIPSDRIERMAQVLEVTPAYIMGWQVEDESSAAENWRESLPSNIIPVPKTYEVPLVGDIACGQPILAVEDAEEVVSVPEDIQADFALRCRGDSMITARIFDGDVVYIKRQPQVENGQIAAVRIGDEATLKRVYYSQDDSRITLRACNPLYPDLVYEGDKLDEIEILGLAVGFFSRVRHE